VFICVYPWLISHRFVSATAGVRRKSLPDNLSQDHAGDNQQHRQPANHQIFHADVVGAPLENDGHQPGGDRAVGFGAKHAVSRGRQGGGHLNLAGLTFSEGAL